MSRLDQAAPGLLIAQPERGFRYGAEAFWLVGFALEVLQARGLEIAGERALDLGTGSGVIAGLLATHGMIARGVELREEWAPLWQRTLRASPAAVRLRLEVADLRSVQDRALLVCTNPPFFPSGSGPTAADAWRAAARTESTATLADVLAAIARCLSPRGIGCLILPVERAAEVVALSPVHGLSLDRQVQVGARRWLCALRVDPSSAPPPLERYIEQDPVVLRWAARARQA
ncbi:MAG: hypothetical protein EA397_11450 [Deltaproteobacteria bacterium]|nr:MAG: hypothetical protein EA397_11450 [Deltaproteobacteria bacterium]